MRDNLVLILVTSLVTCMTTIIVIFSMATVEAEIVVGEERVQMPGIIEVFSGSNIPDGYLLCNGQEVSREEYTNLFKVIGTTYGEGDGNTTFNLPDLSGRVAVGKNSGTFNNLGKTLGVETSTLAISNLPSHNHTIPALSGSTNTIGQHTHGWNGWTAVYSGSDYTAAIFGTDSAQGFINEGKGPQAAGNHSHTVTTNKSSTGNTGSGSSFTNIQPSLIINYIIKY